MPSKFLESKLFNTNPQPLIFSETLTFLSLFAKDARIIEVCVGLKAVSNN
jgi:hypothetical protein